MSNATGKNWFGRATALLAVIAFLIGITLLPMEPQDVSAAPNAIPTPLAITGTGETPKLAVFFDGQAITEDTRSCVDSTYYDKMDLHTILDHGVVNTTTLTLEFTNNRTTWPDGIAAVTASAADADALNQFNIFGVQTCVFANVTNSEVITITAIGLMK
jgi:hypothetical protein